MYVNATSSPVIIVEWKNIEEFKCLDIYLGLMMCQSHFSL